MNVISTKSPVMVALSIGRWKAQLPSTTTYNGMGSDECYGVPAGISIKGLVSSQHIRYAICSLGPDLLSIAQVEQLWRWHWTIENGNHYRRDVSFGEDRCQSHVLDSAQIRAALRNAMLGLIRLE